MADGRYVDANGRTVPSAAYRRTDGSWGWSVWMPADGSAGTSVGPQSPPEQVLTSQQSAQKVIDRYWAWTNAGSKTVEVPDPSKPGTTMPVAVDPATGQADAAFPTISDITAARAEVGTKATDDPQSGATLAETLKRTELLQTQIDAAKAKPTTTVISTPATDQFIVRSDGTQAPNPNYVPPRPAAPSSTQANVDAKDAADIAHTNAQTGAVETPAQALARQVAAATATARAQGQAEIDKAQALVDSGVTMTESAKLQLQATLAGIQADHDATIKQAQDQYTHDLAQPQVDITNKREQQTADAATQNAATNAATQQSNALEQQRTAQQASVNTQVDALKAQGAQGQARMDTVVKAGSATPMSMATFRMAADPLQLAFQLAHQAIATGDLPPSALPTPNSAPQPAPAVAGPPSAPQPAPGVVAPTQPTAPTPAYMYGAGPGPINEGAAA